MPESTTRTTYSKLSKQDRELLRELNSLRELAQSKGYQYLKTFLYQLVDLEWPNPRKYLRKEKLLLDYQSKYEEANVARKVIEYIETAESGVKEIEKRYELEEPYVG